MRFHDFIAELEREAQAEGPEAIAELEGFRRYFCRELGTLLARRPDTDDQTLLEELTRIDLGFETLAEVQNRNALSDEDANNLAARAVREARGESQDGGGSQGWARGG